MIIFMDCKEFDYFIEKSPESSFKGINDEDTIDEFQNSASKNFDVTHDKNEENIPKDREIFSCDDVMMNVLDSNNKILSSFGPHTLTIGKLLGDESINESIFLKIGIWFCLFKPEESLFEISKQETIIFHNVKVPVFPLKVSIELILPEDKHTEVHNIFKVVLNKCNLLNLSECDKERDLDFTNSSQIIIGAEYIASYLIKGAEKTAELLDATSSYLVDKNNSPSQPKKISPEFQKTVQTAKIVSEKMLGASEYLGGKCGAAISGFGKHLSSYLKKDGVTLLASTYHMQEEEAEQKMQTILNIASVTADGFSIVYEGLDRAKNILLQNVTKNTVEIMKSKYGDDAGGITNDALATVHNMYGAHSYLKICKPKEFAKVAVKKNWSRNT